MYVYSIDQAHQTPYTVRVLFPTSHRTELGHLFLALSQDNIFHGNADQFADGNHADNVSSTRTILSTSWECSSNITYRRNNVYSSTALKAQSRKLLQKVQVQTSPP